jgi:hypothetical protein
MLRTWRWPNSKKLAMMVCRRLRFGSRQKKRLAKVLG